LPKPGCKLSDLSLVDEAEKQALLEAWKETKRCCAADKTVHQLFEEHCPAATPDRGAAVYNGVKWTYGELNAKAPTVSRAF
jgi:lichenysin synthetase A